MYPPEIARGGSTKSTVERDGFAACGRKSRNGSTCWGTYVDELILFTNGAEKFYAHANHLYSVAAMTNAAGAVVERYSYTAYGKRSVLNAAGVVIQKSTVGQQVGFQGRAIDPESGIIGFRNRYLSPTLGRWVNRNNYMEAGIYYTATKGKPTSVFLWEQKILIAGTNYIDGFSSYFTGPGMRQSLDPSGQPHGPEAFGQMAGVGAFDAAEAQEAAQQAIDSTRSAMWNGELPNCRESWTDGPADAYRHCYWMCRLSQRITLRDAVRVGEIHEEYGGNNPNALAMDLRNNAMGAAHGQAIALGIYRFVSCKDICLKQLKDGVLSVINKDCPCDAEKKVKADPGRGRAWD